MKVEWGFNNIKNDKNNITCINITFDFTEICGVSHIYEVNLDERTDLLSYVKKAIQSL